MRMCGIEQLVGAALVGYNVTVLVYGQTGSGKTFTISGREEAPDKDGYGGALPAQRPGCAHVELKRLTVGQQRQCRIRAVMRRR